MQTTAEQLGFAPANQMSSASNLACAQPPRHPLSCLQRLELCNGTAAYAPAIGVRHSRGLRSQPPTCTERAVSSPLSNAVLMPPAARCAGAELHAVVRATQRSVH